MIVLQTLTLLGAMCLFLYGMTLMSEGLQKAAGLHGYSFPSLPYGKRE